MRRAAVFVLRGGLAHWFDVEADGRFYATPEGRVWPPFDPGEWDEVVLVDRHVATGRTLHRAMEALGLRREEVRWAGSCVGDYARKVLDTVLPPPGVRGYLLVFCGPPGAAKSFLARGIAEYRGLPYYKVGRYALALGPGRYGEALAEKERVNPFLVAEHMAPDLRREASPLVLVDGVKTPEQLDFLSYTTCRPAFAFYVDSPFSEKMVARRRDPDDAYAAPRLELFREGLGRLREVCTAVSAADFRSLRPVAEVLERFGFSCPAREWGYDVFGTKRIWLDVYRKLSLNGRYASAEPDPDVEYHSRYLEKYGLTGAAAALVRDIATAFRLVDDILDEHRTRWGRPSYWAKRSCVEALSNAVVLTTRAAAAAAALGLEREFREMFEGVLEAVYYELDVEEGRAAFRSVDDWERAARREACFRAFIGVLRGEDPERYYREGLRAQMKDDVFGSTKGGREDTDGRLNRPLWQKLGLNN